MYNLLIVDDESKMREDLSAIPWHMMGVQLIGCAIHGLDALQFISEHQIDIVLTDIRMPFMDGIELIHILQQKHPFIRVIILSGCNNFNYAQKALGNGAVDYLLKPLQKDELVKSFAKLVSKLDVMKEAQLRNAVLIQKEGLYSKLLREEFLTKLFHVKLAADEIELGCSECGILLDGNEYTIAIIRLDPISFNIHGLTDRELKLITFSLDNILDDIWDRKGLGYHSVNKKNAECCLLSKKPSPRKDLIQVKLQLMKFSGLFSSTLSLGVGKTVQEATEIWHSTKMAKQFLGKSGNEDSIVESDNIVVQAAKSYIMKNFHRSITLKEVSNHVYVTPGHLSLLFRGTGESYIQYLTLLRINKAIELLSDVRYKIYEVAEMVGYSDQTYFAEIIRKHTGKAPMEFRGISK
ncbi:response regulator [Paenibacillus psychroresistens]|uniref:Response regulator n=1 Tax=Paenibacillus psychroresistens TaxID=1778678 RepID=A0A6B8RP19_9BACL|nr:response regulator [Paenibacillus psychroresistens]QGQ98090.1 response regulator [Paenibacillus psychroresistens]